MNELGQAGRSWFGALTFNEDHRWKIRAKAIHDCSRSGKPLEHRDKHGQFGALVAAATPYVTKYLKRVRKAAACRLRFVAIAEPHQDGFPHFHLLLHEVDNAYQVGHAVLSQKWLAGFERWRLVHLGRNGNAAGYLTKYLTKGLGARVRASQSYGSFSYAEGRPTTLSGSEEFGGKEKTPKGSVVPFTPRDSKAGENTQTRTDPHGQSLSGDVATEGAGNVRLSGVSTASGGGSDSESRRRDGRGCGRWTADPPSAAVEDAIARFSEAVRRTFGGGSASD